LDDGGDGDTEEGSPELVETLLVIPAQAGIQKS